MNVIEDQLGNCMSSIKGELKTELDALRSEVRALELKLNDGQLVPEEKVTDRLARQLKGATSMVVQQTLNLQEEFEAQLAAVEG